VTGRGTVLVFGTMGQTPFAGIAWQVLQYLEGFRRLGFDVYYVEDTDTWPFDPVRNAVCDDCRYAVGFIDGLMEEFGFADRWVYRSGATDRTYGLSDARFAAILERADALVNLTGATILREEHRRVPVRIYLETDPVLPQIEVAQGRRFTIDVLAAHTHHFTFGENLGAPDCTVPLSDFKYFATRQPVVVEWWSPADRRPAAPGDSFTTIGNWVQSGKDTEWNGEIYRWSKHLEFLKFIDLPSLTAQRFELALSQIDADAIRLLEAHGWHVVDAVLLSCDVDRYRDYIRGSLGELTVAKDQNIRLRSGWFSDRSACYLAAGRPVITQDTAFGNILPVGEGLFAFSDMDGILDALERIGADYQRQSAKAREIADQYFKAERVVGDMARVVGL